MSNSELNNRLQLCGKSTTDDSADLPFWMQDCAAKETSDPYKITIIQKAIMENIYYEDADVPLTAPLLKMIMKRSCTGRDGNLTHPSLVHATEGLSPFYHAGSR